ncbi:hypothetical protein ACFL6F_04040 [Planctomycetota bacterium]
MAQTCVVDPKRHVLVGAGHKHVSVWNIGKKNYKRQDLKTTGGDNVIKHNDPGVDYDPVCDKIVAWHGGSVYELDMDTKVWTEHKAEGFPKPSKWGTFGRWKYVPIVNAYIVVNNINENVYFYKLTAGGPAHKANPLSGLPSKPGPHIDKIKALGNNEWLVLGKPKADPKWGTARGRSWGVRQTYASDLEGAFFCGCGVHGYVNPDGYYMDDLWFYDINQHKWICLYPGANTKTLKLKLDKHSFEVNEKGECTPVSYLSHTYGSVTYIPGIQKYMIAYTNCPHWARVLPQRKEWLGFPPEWIGGAGGKLNIMSRHPLFWDVKTGKWERRFTEGEGPDPRVWGSLIQYIPFLDKVFLAKYGKVWLYDYKSNTWEVLLKRSNLHPKQNSCLGIYDSKRRRVWVAAKKTMDYFDFKTNKWIEVKGEGDFPEKFTGNVNVGSLNYDTVNDVFIYHLPRETKPKRIYGDMYAYDPVQNKWTHLKRTYPYDKKTWDLQNAFYDPKLNAHFYYLAMDSRDNGKMLVYRYKKSSLGESNKEEKK